MALIWNGQPLETKAHVIDWRAHGMQYEHGEVFRRKQPPYQCVVHHTGAENAPDKVFTNLKKRGLSVEFVMDVTGHIYQFADPCKVQAAHCKGLNATSFGIEIQSRGFGVRPATIPAATWARWEKDVPRGIYRAKINRKEVQYAMLRSDQLEALCDFIEAFVEAGILEARIPKLDVTLPRVQALAFKGVLGHYMVSQDKLDPGPQAFEELVDSDIVKRAVR